MILFLLSLLLQQPTGINDITFRTMDVVVIVGGAISLITSFLYQRFQIAENRRSLESLQKQYDKDIEKIENSLDKIGETHGEFKEKIFSKIDGLGEEIHKIALTIQELKNKK